MSDERLTRDVVSSNDNRDPHRHDPSPRMARPFIARGWMIPSDLVYPGEKLDKAGARIQELEAQLLDAKRNEERVVGEVADLRAELVRVQRKAEWADSDAEGVEARLSLRLTALEAAVRAAKDGERRGVSMRFHVLDKLYALVPDGSEGGP